MTHLVKSLFNRNLAVLTVCVAAFVPQALMAANPLCPLGNATKHGTYVVLGTGTIVGVGAYAAMSEATFDGNGNVTVQSTASVNGVIYEDVVLTGTYIVNPDCTGSSTLSNGDHYNTVNSPNGKKYYFTKTDAGAVISGTAEKL
jgi:hypothetical protein